MMPDTARHVPAAPIDRFQSSSTQREQARQRPSLEQGSFLIIVVCVLVWRYCSDTVRKTHVFFCHKHRHMVTFYVKEKCRYERRRGTFKMMSAFVRLVLLYLNGRKNYPNVLPCKRIDGNLTALA